MGSLPLAGLASQEFAAGAAQLLGLSARWCAAHRDLLPAYLRFCFLDMQSPEAAHGGDGLLALYARMIGNSQASGGIRADLPAPYLATMFHHLYLGALMRWLADPALSLDTEFSCALDVFCRGVLRVAPRRGWVVRLLVLTYGTEGIRVRLRRCAAR